MKTTRKNYQPGVQGYALLMTMIFISIALLLLVSVMNWSNSSARQTERNNLFGLGTGAAEAATERMIAQMTFDFFNQNFASGSNYYTTNSVNLLPITTSWPVKFNFSNPSNSSPTYVSVNPINWTTNWGTLFAANYSGMHADIANCTVISTATASNQPYNVSATVKQTFELAAIPIFQYAIFYDLNMEIDPGATMTVTGPVFSNGGIWSGSTVLTFNSLVSAAGNIYNTNSDPFATNYTGSGPSSYLISSNIHQDTLAMPIGQTNDPTAIRALLNLPPAGTAPYSSTGQLYFINQTDLIVSNSPGGTLSAYLQDSNNTPAVQYITPDVTQYITNLLYSYTTNTTKTYTTNGVTHKITTNTVTTITTNTTATVTVTNYYSFATNVSFYDYREGKTVAAVQLNVGALTNWLVSSNGSTFNTQVKNDTGHYIDSVYVYNNAPYTSASLPAVRMANGAVLPSQGLTVVTPDPLYVLGNYNASGTSLNNGTNVANTANAALFGDSITALSTSWNDSWNSSTALSSRNPGATTINAAAFEGIVQTVGANYSGGVENFIRLLENWGSGTTLTYNGSIVVMFPSQYATNKWQATGNYYNAPKRAWAFDLNFQSNSGLPPLTPRVTKIFRQTWSVY
ncbi:MAG TPA: hypothetical protein VKU37_05360 [Verrucomicrobiae bacterium]|nr:hypothetical protein [Verrucomicrobiae bacterium]